MHTEDGSVQNGILAYGILHTAQYLKNDCTKLKKKLNGKSHIFYIIFKFHAKFNEWRLVIEINTVNRNKKIKNKTNTFKVFHLF